MTTMCFGHVRTQAVVLCGTPLLFVLCLASCSRCKPLSITAVMAASDGNSLNFCIVSQLSLIWKCTARMIMSMNLGANCPQVNGPPAKKPLTLGTYADLWLSNSPFTCRNVEWNVKPLVLPSRKKPFKPLEPPLVFNHAVASLPWFPSSLKFCKGQRTNLCLLFPELSVLLSGGGSRVPSLQKLFRNQTNRTRNMSL